MKHICLFPALMPDDGKKRKDGQSILDIDVFSYMLTLTVTLPTLYADRQASSLGIVPMGGLGDLYTLQLVLTAHVVQILLTCDLPSQGIAHSQITR